jgi:hypothetical protein
MVFTPLFMTFFKKVMGNKNAAARQRAALLIIGNEKAVLLFQGERLFES